MLYRFDECELDDRLYQLRRQGQRVEIEPKAFDLLVYLLHHRAQVVAKDELLNKLWPGTVVSEAALTRCIARAREAVGDDGDKQRIIKTQHGRGYRFVAAVSIQTLAPEATPTVIEAVPSPLLAADQPQEEVTLPLPSRGGGPQGRYS
jgi:DNA-binding winged helix-turn-helix (wHTH) protein